MREFQVQVRGQTELVEGILLPHYTYTLICTMLLSGSVVQVAGAAVGSGLGRALKVDSPMTFLRLLLLVILSP